MFFNQHSSDPLRRESRAHTVAKADVVMSLVTVAPGEGVPTEDVLSFGLAWAERTASCPSYQFLSFLC